MTQPEPDEATGRAAGGQSDTTEPTTSYEAARDELLTVVQRLETGGVPLQESVALWERGEELAAICQRWLDGARARLDAAMREPTKPAADG